MNFLRFIWDLLFLNWWKLLTGSPSHPYIPNLQISRDDNLQFNSLTRGGLVIGRPGSGKTRWMAKQVLNYALEYPDLPIISLDASGSFTDDFIALYQQLPSNQKTDIDRRIVYDRIGDPDFVIPFPFLSPDYGLDYEEQVQRVTENFKNLSPHLVAETPVMALGITETLPHLLRLLFATQNEQGQPWQITEAKKLLTNFHWLQVTCKLFGTKVPEAAWYFENTFLNDQVSNRERELRTYTLRSVLGMIESKSVRARVGYDRPGWTPQEAIKEGLIVLVSGEVLINQPQAQAILFTDVFTQIMAQVNKRQPHDPTDKPILLTIDEVYSLTRIPGMATEIGKIPPQYRSRRMLMIIVIQALWQLAENLREQVWSMGNVTCFGVDDFNEAYQVVQQLFKYDPESIRLLPPSDKNRPIVETDRGQYLTVANWLQHLPHRACVMKRYRTEREEEPFVAYIEQTSESPIVRSGETLSAIKEQLHRRRAIPVKDALKLINRRKIRYQPNEERRRTIKL